MFWIAAFILTIYCFNKGHEQNHTGQKSNTAENSQRHSTEISFNDCQCQGNVKDKKILMTVVFDLITRVLR